ncbi:HDOD domain-containing protein [Chitinimonas sp. BJYL2]|uniref:HDOD domain-containing protein n=1 Tax=Chitinimonas sp. BJYL2 TaxID=2976696 RepID=UPI0022B4A204|nr:HDOD domain-containing protein [Chitinimonas sp. BJYL2]
MEEKIYTLISQQGGVWLAKTEDGQPALLVPDPGLALPMMVCDARHPVMAVLDGDAEIDGEHWLAYRWAPGVPLSRRIEQGAMPLLAAVRLTLRLLDGATHARLVGLALGTIDADRVVMVTDEQPLLAAALPVGAPVGSPIEAFGGLLFQLLTGVFPHPDANGERPALRKYLPEVDVRLETLIEGALDDAHVPRFDNLLAFRNALSDYLSDLQAVDVAAEAADDPAFHLRRQLEGADGFPALSRAIGAISRVSDSDTEKLQVLASIILRDFSLTNKVLRLANSVTYGQFGGGISTISRAVMVLGLNTIKGLALTSVLIEHLQDHPRGDDLRDEVVRAFLASLIARKIAERCGYREPEEARVAGMFHLLGRLLALCYFPTESDRIDEAIRSGERESVAVPRELGASYEALGMSVARSWNLPGKLVSSLADEDPKPRTPRTDGDWLRLFANAGKRLTQATLAEPEPERVRAFLTVRDGYGPALQFAERDFRSAVDEASREALREAAIFGMESQGSGVLARLRKLAGLPTVGGPKPASVDEPPPVPSSPTVVEPVAATAPAATAPATTEPRPDVIEALATCVQDVTETLVGEFRLNDLLRMILETLYRSLGADRVVLATRSVQRNAIVGRFGFGTEIDDFLTRFRVPLDEGADVFRVSLSQNADILIEDIDNLAIRDRIPAWFRQIGAGRTFLLLPVVIDRRVVGLFYADCDKPGSFRLAQRELALCKTLRNQAILAIRQKTPGGPG